MSLEQNQDEAAQRVENPQEQEPTQHSETENILPDFNDQEASEDKTQTELKSLQEEKDKIAQELDKVREENKMMEKRVRDTQDKMHALSDERNKQSENDTAQNTNELEQYVEKLKQSYDTDPGSMIEKLVRDIAYDRSVTKREFNQQIEKARDEAYQKALRANPEFAKTMDAVQELETERPEMKGVPMDIKMEYVKLKNSSGRQEQMQQERQAVTNSQTKGRQTQSETRIPDWANDPSVQSEAKGMFNNKKELVDWANVNSFEDAKKLMRSK